MKNLNFKKIYWFQLIVWMIFCCWLAACRDSGNNFCRFSFPEYLKRNDFVPSRIQKTTMNDARLVSHLTIHDQDWPETNQLTSCCCFFGRLGKGSWTFKPPPPYLRTQAPSNEHKVFKVSIYILEILKNFKTTNKYKCPFNYWDFSVLQKHT